MLRLGVFAWERFPVLAYGPLIGALVICGTTGAAVASNRRPEFGWPAIQGALAVALAFFQLRVLDELRDEEMDRAGRPDRPLPRGLVSNGELRALAVAVAITSMAVALPLGEAALRVLAVTVAVIWTFGTEQPRRLPIRYGVVGEALIHSIISPLLLLFVWVSSASAGSGTALGASLLLVWGGSLALEVARKTLRAEEERPGVSSYSGELGRGRALMFAALAIAAAFAGAAGFSLSVGAPPALVGLPLAGAIAIPISARRYGSRAGTLAIRVTAAILILGLLLWPVVVMVGVA